MPIRSVPAGITDVLLGNVHDPVGQIGLVDIARVIDFEQQAVPAAEVDARLEFLPAEDTKLTDKRQRTATIRPSFSHRSFSPDFGILKCSGGQ